jgi:transaldolase
VNGEVVSRIDAEIDQSVIDELSEKLVDYNRAYDESAMSEDEYYDYGGVELFRSSFMKGWNILLDLIADMRKELT